MTTENDINRWRAMIQERPEGPWIMGNGGSFDRTVNRPISDEMMAELATWLRMGYTPWNGRSMPLSAADRQFMFILYYSVQGLVSRVRSVERISQPCEPTIAECIAQLDTWNGHLEAAIDRQAHEKLGQHPNDDSDDARDPLEQLP